MGNIYRTNDDLPFRGEAYYQVAHEAEPSFFDDITTAIDDLFLYAASPILNREFTFEQDGSCSSLETTIMIDDNHDTSKVNVEQTLSIVHTACTPPRCVKDYYHIRVADKVEVASNPILTEYYIERLSNGLYFGTMRRLDLTIGINGTHLARNMYGDEEPMTVYDLFELVETLSAHYDGVKQEAVYASFIQDNE